MEELTPKLGFVDEYGVLPQIAYALNSNKTMMLVGDTGTGKSYVIRELCEAAQWKYETINFHSAVTQGEIVGKYDFDATGKVVWHDGVLTRCMKEGKVCICEEANGMRSEVSLCFYSPMDEIKNRELTLSKKDGEVVKAHPDFRLVFTGNLGYRGTEKFNPAIQNRIAVWVDIPYLSQEVEAQLLIQKTKIGKDTAINMTRVAAAVRANREKSGFRPLSTRTMLWWAQQVVDGKFEPLVAAENTIIPTLADEPKDRDIVRQFVKQVFQKRSKDDDE